MAQSSGPNPGPARELAEAVQEIGGGLFGTWRRALGTVARVTARIATALRSAASAWLRQWKRVWAYHHDPLLAWQPGNELVLDNAAAAGGRGFLVGIVIAAWVVATAQHALLPGVVAAGSEVLWTGTRFIIIALLMPRAAIDRRALSVAFLAGLLPYAAGATAGLRLLALLASAFLTRRGLVATGLDTRDVDRAIAWSFGGQLGVIAAGWLMRAAIALLAML